MVDLVANITESHRELWKRTRGELEANFKQTGSELVFEEAAKIS